MCMFFSAFDSAMQDHALLFCVFLCLCVWFLFSMGIGVCFVLVFA